MDLFLYVGTESCTFLAFYYAIYWVVIGHEHLNPDGLGKRSTTWFSMGFLGNPIAGGPGIGFAVFYGLDNLVNDPLWFFKVWLGGMSFHGGLLGVLVALWLFAQKDEQTVF
ncbi:MAG: hypothetical protein CM1200mP24_06920 [Gammaproteobacteria bacterium]|nr:MAG: hypothetical protein CM1200mP24_06920 [Gammaproteobacteria bacterium]